MTETKNDASPSVQKTRPYIRIKILSMGEGSVGKSCLIKRYCEGKFVSKYISTIGVDFGVRPVVIDDVEVKVNFWDLSGHPEFFQVRNEFYKDSQAALLVFDVTSKKSFQALEQWLREQSKFSENTKPLITVVCGNKTDLEKRLVTEAEARKWAEEKGFPYFETSAKSGQNVTEMFTHMFKGVLTSLKKSIP